jgi:two-component SAPR family response regulator
MTVEQMLIGLLGIISATIGWFARELYTAVHKLREDLSRLEVKISTDYVRYDRLAEALKPLADGIQEIKSALMHKADKP